MEESSLGRAWLNSASERLDPTSHTGVQLSVVTDGTTGKRSAVPNFYPYRTRIGSHNLPLAAVCIEYAVHTNAAGFENHPII